MAWCLLPDLTRKFLDALRKGEIDPEKLAAMSSAERRAEFAKILGEDNAREVNSQFEAKLLLKDQRTGLANWARKIGGLTEPARRDIIAQINRLDRVLSPDEEHSFLEDLAAKKLGVTVTADEAKTILTLAQKAEQLRAAIVARGGSYAEGWTAESGREFGLAKAELAKTIEAMKPDGRTKLDLLVDILNIPKSLLTSILHLSAPGVQGWGTISTKQGVQGIWQMLRYFYDEKNYDALNADIIGHPLYEHLDKGGLRLTKLGAKLTAREEAIQSTLVELGNQWLVDRWSSGDPRARPFYGANLVRASSRAFTGYLNYVRFNRAVDLIHSAEMHGEDVGIGSSAVHDIAKAVNDFTGAATELNLGVTSAEIPSGAVPALNAIFFSPRKLAATMEMFNPINMLDPRISATARMARVRQLGGSILATGTVLALAKSMGAQVDLDPRSQNFLKIQIGGEKLDITGGNAVYLRLIARLITGETISAKGKMTVLGEGYKPQTRAGLIEDFLRNKLSPVAGFTADALYGSDPTGRPFSLTTEMQDKLMPIVIDSFVNYAMNDPSNASAVIPSLAAIFGVGLESPLPPVSHSGLNVWGEPTPAVGTPRSWTDDPVNQEAEKVGLSLNLPPRTIRGVRLTDEQYDRYILLSGSLAHQRLEALVGRGSFQEATPQRQLQEMTTARTAARGQARRELTQEGVIPRAVAPAELEPAQ